jgi:hypothetical protein
VSQQPTKPAANEPRRKRRRGHTGHRSLPQRRRLGLILAAAFQARDPWRHTGPPFGSRLTGSQRTRSVTQGRASLRPSWCPALPGCGTVSRRPCHYRAIYDSHDRSGADNCGQRRSAIYLRRSLSSQVTSLPDLACKQEVGWSRLASALPCPAGRSGPWSRRTGAPEASATRRDRTNPGPHWSHMRSDADGQHQ